MAMHSQVTAKSEATRARILGAALGVFRERGFHAATMREIAATADLAVGAAYYYFESKDALVMAFYEQSQDQMAPALDRILANCRSFEARLRGIISCKFEHFGPNRILVATLSAHIDPEHPLSPFSAATKNIRDRDVAYFKKAVSQSGLKLHPSILPYLPRLLWLYQMGLMLFWVYDRSPEQKHTALLFDTTLRIILLALKLAGLPLLKSLYRPAGELLKTIYGEI